MPTVVITSLPDVAVQVGANRILRLRKSTFHYPFGVPDLDSAGERAWRREALRVALNLLRTPVDKPTVFDF
jgi:hypothetical protein